MKGRVEFDGTLEAGGLIRVPEDVRGAAGLAPGTRLRVRLTPRALDTRLKTLGIDDEEIDRIAGLQAAPPDQIIRCLLSEGACAHPSRRRGGR